MQLNNIYLQNSFIFSYLDKRKDSQENLSSTSTETNSCRNEDIDNSDSYSDISEAPSVFSDSKISVSTSVNSSCSSLHLFYPKRSLVPITEYDDIFWEMNQDRLFSHMVKYYKNKNEVVISPLIREWHLCSYSTQKYIKWYANTINTYLHLILFIWWLFHRNMSAAWLLCYVILYYTVYRRLLCQLALHTCTWYILKTRYILKIENMNNTEVIAELISLIIGLDGKVSGLSKQLDTIENKITSMSVTISEVKVEATSVNTDLKNTPA